MGGYNPALSEENATKIVEWMNQQEPAMDKWDDYMSAVLKRTDEYESDIISKFERAKAVIDEHRDEDIYEDMKEKSDNKFYQEVLEQR